MDTRVVYTINTNFSIVTLLINEEKRQISPSLFLPNFTRRSKTSKFAFLSFRRYFYHKIIFCADLRHIRGHILLRTKKNRQDVTLIGSLHFYLTSSTLLLIYQAYLSIPIQNSLIHHQLRFLHEHIHVIMYLQKQKYLITDFS